MKRVQFILCALIAVASCKEQAFTENRTNPAVFGQQRQSNDPDMGRSYKNSNSPEPDPPAINEPFIHEMEALDSLLYTAAYNNRDTGIARALIHDDFELYHDRTGILEDMDTTTASEIMIQRFQDIGNHYKRKLQPGSLRSYPLYDGEQLYGAIQEGINQYHKAETGDLEGTGHFIHLWIRENGQWKLKRVISYNHQAIPQ